MISYINDFFYGATKYPCALFKPQVFMGYFGNTEKNSLQILFFKKLLDVGFKRTMWQLVFPGQTAGVIKKVSTNNTSENEYHIRFYNDGTIECEFEVDRLSTKHWSGPRRYVDFGTFEKEFGEISLNQKDGLSKLFVEKHFSTECVC